MPLSAVNKSLTTGEQVKDALSGVTDGHLLTDDQFLQVNRVSDSGLSSLTAKDVTSIQAGTHPDGEQHNLGLAQQIEVGHLTDAFLAEQLAEILRWMGSSGILGVRQYDNNASFAPNGRRTHSIYAAVNLHNHANYNSMPGIGELAMLINGYYYRSRHNDYIMYRSIAANATTLGKEKIFAPAIKASVMAKPTGVTGDTIDVVGDTQARYFKNIYTNNPEDVEVQLSYIELWWETSDGTSTDNVDSFRHADAVDNIREAFETGKQFNADGIKNSLENYNFAPNNVQNAASSGASEVGSLNFRIMVMPVGTIAEIGNYIVAPIISIAVSSSHSHVLNTQMTDQEANDLVNSVITTVSLTSTDVGHTHVYDITWDGSKFVGIDTNVTHQHEILIEQNFTGNIPFDKTKSIAGTIDNTNVYALVKDQALLDSMQVNTWEEYIDTRMPRFSVENLDRMCERCPGLNGEGAFIGQTNPVEPAAVYEDRDGGTLNAAYYSRRIARAGLDAAGRSAEDRGFNDSNLFVAKTTKSNVINGVSYMIPLELIERSPLENWNPYQIAEVEDRAAVEALGGDGTQPTPYEAYSDQHYYHLIPFNFYIDGANVDPADTAGNVFMRSGIDGVARRCWASGVRPFLQDLSRRQRFPIYPVFSDYSPESVRIAALERQYNASNNLEWDAGGIAKAAVPAALELAHPAATDGLKAQRWVFNIDPTSVVADEVTANWYFVTNVSNGTVNTLAWKEMV